MAFLNTRSLTKRVALMLVCSKEFVSGCLFAGFLLISACQSSIYSYKANDGRIPAIQLTWVNEKAEDRKIHTGSTEMKIRVWSKQPIAQPYTIHFTYRDGYTYHRTELPAHTGRGNTTIDTIYTFVTKRKINAPEDSDIRVSALLRAGKYGLATGKTYKLGMSLNWLVRVGNCSYSDGAGNTTDFRSTLWHYQPVRPEESSSGTYSGGMEVEKTVTEAQKDSLLSHIRTLVQDTKQHTNKRLRGTGLLQFKRNSWRLDYIIHRNSSQKEAFEEFLKTALRH